MSEEQWMKGDDVAVLTISEDGVVQVSVDLLRTMLTDLGWQPIIV
jgi:hypothetical protein